jgi:hypothetical protein
MAQRSNSGRKALVVSLLTAAAFVVAPVAPASAATNQNGTAEAGEWIYYYNSGHQGSISDFTIGVSDLLGYGYVKSGLAGYGAAVKNKAASGWNRKTSGPPLRVYFNSGYAGSQDVFESGEMRNLNSTLKNNNAAHRWAY